MSDDREDLLTKVAYAVAWTMVVAAYALRDLVRRRG